MALQLIPISKDALEGAVIANKVAEIFVTVGEYDAAIDLLENLLSIPSQISVNLLRIDPIWEPVRDHPRFQRLIEQYSEVES